MPTAPHETVLCRYRYDPLDHLIDCAPTVEARTQRFYCKSRLATEIQGAVQCSVFQHDDQLLAQIRREDLKADTTLLATDHQRSVLNALDVTCLHPLAYTPYGHRPAENGLLSLLGFNGERPDSLTGHYLLGNGYRAFNPVLMRFNSPDSWSPFGEGGLNTYAYCKADPINRTDPTGHIFTTLTRFFKNIFANSPAKKMRLTDLDPNSFQKISKYLSSSDMNSLRLVSKETKEMTDQASNSNFKIYLNKKIYNRRGTAETPLDKVIEVGLGRKPGISSSEASKTISLNMAQNLFPTHATPGYTYRPTSLITGETLNFKSSYQSRINRRHSYTLADELEKLPSHKEVIIETEHVIIIIRRGSL
ncbi:RHS repeat-associated core domain-containing protein [Pseudomonas sp. NFACC15-1]|uniref:RHS repeat-associated core domain-containing protein n=1 Tax=unclassified Pseudomonas TaxID=196821 RepID=UPI00088DFBB8|nr:MULTISPECIES: RHS repeat-associated core domain-containing protein [unclassified Pseudomonas]SDA79038.1 RHS repeat-associated core domain-containing protein [Pseudomonas sp. NFACC15-1]SDY42968.1 RHS repeat-associated core domain-containing protein [Pseudomonas sp. NFACC14]